MSSAELWALFEATYLAPVRQSERLRYVAHHLHEAAQGRQGITLTLHGPGRSPITLKGVGSGPIEATVAALGLALRIDHYEERSRGSGAAAEAIATVEGARPGVPGTRFGVGCDRNVASAAVAAVLSLALRLGVDAAALASATPA
jgi:2-isopropylmalate synthase